MHPDAPPGTEPEDLASQARRRHAFGEVVEPEIEVLLRVARSLTGAESDAEDLVQETLIRAFGALDRFDGRHPRAWLLTILRRTHLNMHRRRRPSATSGRRAGAGTRAWPPPRTAVLDATAGRQRPCAKGPCAQRATALNL